MSREFVNDYCATLPGAECSDPFGGSDCWKVGGKIFALTGLSQPQLVSVKTDGIETAQMLIEGGFATRAPYLHQSWVALPLDAAPDELRHRIEVSYRLIRSKLPRKVQAVLAPF